MSLKVLPITLRPILATACLAALGLSARAALTVDVSNRENTRIFYNAIWPASENVASGWTGNTTTGVAGTTSLAFQNAILLRTNYFRAMSGVPSGTIFNTTWNSMCQQSALMMSANNALSHSPPTTWKYYTANGATAAANSNLALNFYGPGAINSYMEDPGTNNTAAGHRRWIFYPQTKNMGTGDVAASGTYLPANSLWIMDTANMYGPRPAVRDTFVAWPPKGYVPYQIIYPRWSFSYPNADFSAATVSMTRNGAAVPVSKTAPANGYGENTLVFIPDNLNPNAWAGPVAPAADTTSTVTVGNVKIGGVAKSFTYNVISFDPSKAGTGTVATKITGPTQAKINVNTTYSVNALTLATGYQWKYFKRSAYTVVDGAETAGTVTATVPTSYSFRTTDVKAAGSYSYHLAHPNFQVGWFKLNPTFVANSGATLKFMSRLGYATNYETAKVDVSVDGGSTWQNIWQQAGSNSAGETSFFSRSLSLAAYVGKEIQIRFYYDLRTGSTYTQTSTGVGWYIDSISLTSTDQETGVVTSGASTSLNYLFKPTSTGTYGLEVREQVYGAYYLGWAGLINISAVN